MRPLDMRNENCLWEDASLVRTLLNRKKMNRLPAILLALLALTTSCEKVIDLDLKTSSTQIVIEATLPDDGSPAVAVLSQTVAYSETNQFPAVSGATLLLTDETTGTVDTLRETTTPGRYAGRLAGLVGHRYTLDVASGGQHYVAHSTMPPVVPLAGVALDAISFGPNDRLNVRPLFLDPAGVRNYYYFQQSVNGKPQKTIYLQDDEFSDGNPNTQGLRGGFDEEKLLRGDTVRVKMHNLDVGAYEYFRTLNQILASNPLFTTTPTNPVGNFTNGALGYFSAFSAQTATVVVP